MSEPLYDATGDWCFEHRAKSEMKFEANDEFNRAREALRKNGWDILREDHHECKLREDGRRERTVWKVMFWCRKPEPNRDTPNPGASLAF